MILYIVRHAIAGERDETQWPDDSQRPLTEKGKKRFKKFLKQLDEVMSPTLIATSPFVRCHQTAEILAARLDNNAMVVPQPALQPGSDLDALVKWTGEQTAAEIAWVGHAPDVGHLAAKLIGNGEAHIDFAKGAIAAIEFENGIQAGGGILRWLATAKVLGV
jgi:phosphohistidine phosphatase